ncbi:hypothetical protein [Frankia sp. AgKG'84/4]|uniref:hypothetical protein n=1 Tax=Frankia sp. AgKG'84/4 TaxID=573490 RepID=UPI00200F6F79|nr:hypothetical protein [Frankia sp. AgKG'84/4]MCL9794729.1 hypothetical protein [Frankia sp. AgKG'84/4]
MGQPVGQAAAVLEAVLVLVLAEDEAGVPLPAAAPDEESDEESPLVDVELVLLELAASPAVSFGRCWVAPPEEPDRLSFL